MVDSGVPGASSESHGTNVVGIIGANNISATSSFNYQPPQMNGVVSGIKDMKYSLEVRRLGSFGLLNIRTIYDAASKIDELSQGNVSVINISQATWASVGDFILKSHIQNASNTLIVAAAGNDGLNVSPGIFPFNIGSSPADLGNQLNNVIAIGATDNADQRASFMGGSSNFGAAVNMAASGKDVYSPTFFQSFLPLGLNDYDSSLSGTPFDGTSASAPLVTGVAAILRALEPEYQKYTPGLVMSPAKIKEILVASADPVNTDQPLGQRCFNQTAEKGCRLNAHRAVAWLFPPASSTLSVATTTSNSVSLSWTRSDDFKNPDFDSYKIFRSSSPNVTISTTLVTTITNTSQTSFTDMGITAGTTFFYKVFVFDKADLSSGSNELSATTLPSFPPPTPVNIQFFYPQYNVVNYFGVGWSKNNDSNFASYKIYRANHSNVSTADTLVTAITDQNQVFFKDSNLLPGNYFYKVFVFNTSGINSPGSEVSGRIFSQSELVTRIPGIPEPGDTNFSSNVAVPDFVFEISRFDCPRSIFDFFQCTGPFTSIGSVIDAFGHVSKLRFFHANISNNKFNDINNFEFITHNQDNAFIFMDATDDSYTVFIPDYGFAVPIPPGSTKSIITEVFSSGDSARSSQIIIQNSSGVSNSSAGFLVAVP